MTGTVTIRLTNEDRAVLEAEARERGTGLSALLRRLAEDEARRARRAAIRAEGQRIVDHVNTDPAARAELADLGTPQADLG